MIFQLLLLFSLSLTHFLPLPSSRIPLLPRQPLPEPAEEKSAKKKGGGLPSPPPAEDLTGLELDQQLVIHAYNTAMGTVNNVVSN